ncbi:class B sortase [Vagococcus elongatus]|uniref:SrtB family sortase n=1 Tax=Vagococcus elongatus TaxID=180344 RepID=A0A430ANW1_9ENTE|nr:class B sortase [Vagococcus elongatus]RSU09860.1 SrtB family sortase [Vagococcus elongatus]
MKRDKWLRAGIKLLDNGFNFCVLMLFLLLFLFSSYAIWDSEQLYATGSSKKYEVYKPDKKESKSFEELTMLNSDVFGWVSVFGTQIDHPLVQAQDNEKYVSTDVEGNYSMAGSIFLDYKNAKDFSDFNTIVYGHHMEKSAMFGDLDLFFDQDFFEKHPYGNLYFDGKDHGIEFFAFMEVDAFDTSIFYTPVTGDEAKNTYLQTIQQKSMYTRPMDISINDRLILLSTCTENSTNGRHILIGRIVDQVYPDTFQEAEKTVHKKNFISGLFQWEKHGWLLMVLLFLLLLGLLLLIMKLKKKRR